jgi:hypothetical protein
MQNLKASFLAKHQTKIGVFNATHFFHQKLLFSLGAQFVELIHAD